MKSAHRQWRRFRGRWGRGLRPCHFGVIVAAASVQVSGLRAAQLPASLDLTTIRAIPVQHDGRWPPLDTVARDIVESVTGEVFHQGHDPVLILLAWTFDPPTWRSEPLISIANAELRRELQLSASQTVFSFAELTRHRPLRELIQGLARIERGRKLNPLESKVSGIHNQLNTLGEVFAGVAIRPIPDPEDEAGAWRPIRAVPRGGSESLKPVRNAWASLRQAFLADDPSAFASASEQLGSALASLPAAHRPDPERIATELRYNRLHPYGIAWRVMLAAVALAAVALAVRQKALDVLAVLVMIAGFAVLTYGLSLRWQIAGRIPATNMFESLLFLSWGMGAFAILSMVLVRDRVVPLTASAMGALALVLADVLPMDSFIRPIPPVLRDTVWMSIHVPIIMVSYSVLALAVLVAHVQILTMAAAPARRRWAAAIDNLHYWYVHVGAILLLAGIVTGSMWAASSWGRYWGWDPKEVWSLIALLGYLTILHMRVDRAPRPAWVYAVGALLAVAVFVLAGLKLAPLTSTKVLGLVGAAVAVGIFVLARGPFATALKSIVAFWLIIMTYVGVNYVLGIGLHSYGFGTGAVVRYMFLIGGIDLVLVALCGVVYLVRRGSRPSPGVGAELSPGQALSG